MRNVSGFSLVELSIVLVILGLLVGGVLSGQALIRAAEMRSVTEDYKRYQASVHTFRDKYFALPGDMLNATRFWGEAHSDPVTCRTTASTSALTCDGDGDGKIATGTWEMLRAWQHLANAGLIEGSYSGVGGSGGTYHHVPGENAPALRLKSGMISMRYTGPFPGSADGFLRDRGNLFDIGGDNGSSYAFGKIFTPEEVWNIDTKLDDGKPALGKVTVRYWNDCTNAVSFSNLEANYELTNTARQCSFYISEAF